MKSASYILGAVCCTFEEMRMELTFTLNGEPVTVEAAAEALLVDVLRDHLGLTGKIGRAHV
mgnify:CR=1 FL=1